MKKEILIIGLLLLSGCSDGVIYTNSTDDVSCTLKCKEIMEDYICHSTYPKLTNYCQCLLLDCVKTPPMESNPSDYKEFQSYSVVNSNSECYRNGVLINCSEIN